MPDKYPWLANRSANNLFKKKINLKNYFVWLFKPIPQAWFVVP